MELRTLKYGVLPVALRTTYLRAEVIDLVVDCEANVYEIRLTDNGSLVALKCYEN